MKQAVTAGLVAAACAVGTAQAADMTAPEPVPPEPVPVSGPKWQPWAELGGYWGSDDTSRGEGVLWAPLWQSPASLMFAELRGKFFEEDVQEGNFALGYRQMLASGWNIGIWGGFDVRGTEAGNTFWQASGGLEALSADWDLRVNGYLPLQDDKLISRASATDVTAAVGLTANQIFLSTTTTTTTATTRELALWGFDGEVGYRLFGTPEAQPGPRHELRLYGGGFYFDHSDLAEEVAGPKARLEWRIDEVIGSWAGSRLTLEGEFSHDDVRDARWEVGARLRLPFGGGGSRYAALSPQERRMTDGLERDTDIVTETQTTTASRSSTAQEGVEDALTDVPFDQVAYVDDGGSITTTSTNEGDNTLIIAEGTISGSQQLQGNQTLQGGGSTIQVRGQQSGTVADFTAPGAQPTLATPGNANNLTLVDSNTHVAGLSIQGAGPGNFNNHGIFGGSGLSNMVVEQTSIADTGGNGIFFQDTNTNVTIADTTITDAGFGGIFFGNDNTVTIADTTIRDTGNNGIAVRNGNTVDIAGTTISNTGGDGIQTSDNNTVSIADTSITDAGGDGIDLLDGNEVSIAGTTISDTGDNGIIFVDDNAVDIAGTTIRNTGDDGIGFNTGNTVDIADATITDAAEDGIIFNDSNDVDIAGTTISNTGLDGLFSGTGNDVTLEDSTFAGNIDGDVIDVGPGDTLSGAGNTAAGATIGSQFCSVTGAQTGSFSFDDDGSGNPGTCP